MSYEFARNEIKRLYIEEGYSTRMIEAEIMVGRNIVAKILREEGLIRNKSESSKLAIKSGRKPTIKMDFPMTDEHKANLYKSRFPNGPKGFYMKNGYRLLTVGDNVNREEHIVIMENHLKRKLNKNEVIHHINGNRSDNRIDNLSVMTRSEHTRYHRLLKHGLSQEALYDIFFSDMRVMDVSRKHKIERHRVSSYRKNKRVYTKILNIKENECKQGTIIRERGERPRAKAV